MERNDIEMLSASLVREYLARKRLVNTLRQLDEEQSEYSTCVRNRLKLLKALRIGRLMKRNKKQDFALDSMVEIIVHFLLGHARDSRGKTKVLQSNHQYEHTEDHLVKLSSYEGFPQKSLYQEEISIIEANTEEALAGKVACDKEVEEIPLIWGSTEQRKPNITKNPNLLNHDLRGNTSTDDVTRAVSSNVASNISRSDNNQGSHSNARHQHHETIEVCDIEKQYDEEQLSHLELQAKNSANEIQSAYELSKDLVSNKSSVEGSETQRRCSLHDASVDNGILTRENSIIYQDHDGSALEESETDSASESCASVINLLRDGCGNDNTITTDIFRKESAMVRMSGLSLVKNNSAVDTHLDEVKVTFAWMEECNNEEMERGADQPLDGKELEKSTEEIEEMEKWASERPEKLDRYNGVTVEKRNEESREEPDVMKLPSEEEEVRVIFDSEERQRISHGCREDTGSPQSSPTLLAAHGCRDAPAAKTWKSCRWPGWADDAGDDTETCEPCPEASTRGDQCAAGVEGDDVLGQPWERAGVHLCSFPATCEGFAYMAVAVDHCTDRLEAAPLKTKSAESVAQFLLCLICHHACGEVEIHDQRRGFVRSVSKHLHTMTGRLQRITSAQHPRENRLTDSNYKTIQNSMLKLLKESPDNRPKVLPGGLFVYRSGKQKSGGYMPSFLLCGRQAGLARECEDECGDKGESIACTEVMDGAVPEMIEGLAALEKLPSLPTREGMSNISAQEHQTRDCKKRHREKVFDVGDTVLLWNLQRRDKRKTKDPWLCPYTIHAVLDDGSYELKTSDGTILKQKVLSVNLKTYNKKKSLAPVREKKLEEEDSVSIVRVTDAIESELDFVPTSSAWRVYHAARLNLPKPKKMEERKQKATLSSPKYMDATKGDGNCFFRAMSLELCGTEAYHMRVRKAVVAFLSARANRSMVSSYSGERVQEYLATSGMAKYGTWATDVEIVAMATMLQTTIFVYTKVNETKKWLPYKPLREVRGVHNYKQCVYLSNLASHFERVLACS